MSEKKSRIEVQNCKELLELLKLPVRELRRCSPDPPDVLAYMESGERIGIEVVQPRDNKSKHHTRFFEDFTLQVTKAIREEGFNARMIARWASPPSIERKHREAAIHALLSLLKEKQPDHEHYLTLFDGSDCSPTGDTRDPKCDLLKYWTHIRACAAQQGEFDIEFPDDFLLGKYPRGEVISSIRTKENKLINWNTTEGPYAERWVLIVGGVEGGDLFTSGERLQEDDRVESTFDRAYLYDVRARHVVLVSRKRTQDAPEV